MQSSLPGECPTTFKLRRFCDKVGQACPKKMVKQEIRDSKRKWTLSTQKITEKESGNWRREYNKQRKI